MRVCARVGREAAAEKGARRSGASHREDQRPHQIHRAVPQRAAEDCELWKVDRTRRRRRPTALAVGRIAVGAARAAAASTRGRGRALALGALALALAAAAAAVDA